VRLREIAMRCLKARVLSWLTVSAQGVVVHGVDGTSCVIAVYGNGKRIEPEVVHIPDGIPPEWGMDGPVRKPEDEPGEDDGSSEKDA